MNFKRLALAAALSLGLAAPAFANVIRFSHSTGTASGASPYSENFTLGRFDSNLGTLTDILISMSFNVTGSVSVQNFNAVSESFTSASSWLPITLTGPASTTISASAGTAPVSNTVGAAVVAYVAPYGWMMQPGSFSQTGLTGTPSSSTHVGPSAFSAYEGAGSALLNFSYLAGDGIYGGSSVAGVYFGGSASANGTISIAYTYTPGLIKDGAVPEPEGLALLGLSLGALVLARRRKF